MIRVIAWRELRNLWLSPLGWGVAAVTQLIQGLVFYRLVQAYQAAPVTEGVKAGASYNIAGLFLGTTGYLGLLLVPLLTMGLISGERRQRSLTLLTSAPVSPTDIVLGKYLGVLGYLALLLALLAVMPLALCTATTLDLGLLAAAWFGVFLLLAAYTALGLFCSAWAARPATAAAATVVVLLLFWVGERLTGTGITWLDAALHYLAVFQHYEPMLRGEVDTADVSYFLVFIGLFLALAVQRMRAEGERP